VGSRSTKNGTYRRPNAFSTHFLKTIHEPHCAQGRQHSIHAVIAIAAGAILCGILGNKTISDWAQKLSPKAPEGFDCRFTRRKDIVPSESATRNFLIRIAQVELDRGFQQWNEKIVAIDDSLAIDCKTMCNAIDDSVRQIHIMGTVGYQSKQRYSPKKSAPCL
jgi:hypothetical protein